MTFANSSIGSRKKDRHSVPSTMSSCSDHNENVLKVSLGRKAIVVEGIVVEFPLGRKAIVRKGIVVKLVLKSDPSIETKQESLVSSC